MVCCMLKNMGSFLLSAGLLVFLVATGMLLHEGVHVMQCSIAGYKFAGFGIDDIGVYVTCSVPVDEVDVYEQKWFDREVVAYGLEYVFVIGLWVWYLRKKYKREILQLEVDEIR